MLSEDLQIFSKCLNDFVRPFYSVDAKQISDAHWLMLRDSLSEGQLQSKLHLLDGVRRFCLESNTSDFSPRASSQSTPSEKKAFPLPKKFKKAAFIGHWHGLLPLMFYEFGLIESGIGVELSSEWSQWSKKLNDHWNWQSFVSDAASFDYTDCDLIVNTSCEHMSYDWLAKIPTAGCMLVLQSTDYDIPEHINRVESVDQLESHLLNFFAHRAADPKFEILFRSTRPYEIYKRFTLIGGVHG